MTAVSALKITTSRARWPNTQLVKRSSVTFISEGREAGDAIFTKSQGSTIGRLDQFRHSGGQAGRPRRETSALVPTHGEQPGLAGDNDDAAAQADGRRQQSAEFAGCRLPVVAVILGPVDTSAQAVRQKRFRAEGENAVKRTVIRGADGPPGGSAVGGAQQRAVLARQIQRARGPGGDPIQEVILLDDVAGRPGTTAVGGGEELPVGADDESGLRIEKTNVEKRNLQVRPLVLRGPRDSAVLRVENDRVVAHRPAMPPVREVHTRERGTRRHRRQLPGVSTVGGTEDMTAGSDGDDGLAKGLGVEDQGTRGGRKKKSWASEPLTGGRRRREGARRRAGSV